MVQYHAVRKRPGISTVALITVIIVIIVVASVAAYLYMRTPSQSTKGTVIKIGMTLSESGTFQSLDGDYYKFNQAWQNYVNSHGGLVDASGVHHNVTIIWYDDKSDHDLAVSLYHRLAEQDNVTILISPYSADIGKDLIPIAQADKVPIIMAEASTAGMWVPSNPHDWAVTSMVPYWEDNFTTGWSGSYFDMLRNMIQTNPSSAPKTIAFVGWDITWASDDYASSLSLAKKAGLTIVYQKLLQPDFQSPVSAFQAIIPELKAANPDIVYLATFGPVAALWIKAANQSGFQPKQWHTIEWGAAFQPILGPLVQHVTSDIFWTPAFLNKTGPGYADEQLFWQLLKDANMDWNVYQWIELRMIIFQMIAAAVSQVSTVSRASLNEALHHLDIPTISGRLVVQPQGYGTIALVTVQWQDGKIKTVWPPTVADGKFIYP
jgi:branched-chain amino acid transport system substrate-binding protein